MRKGILDVDVYEDSEKELMLGCLSSLAGSAVWLIAATFLKMPISGTHSIVGAAIGFSLVARGTNGLHWHMLLTIGLKLPDCQTKTISFFTILVGSWFVSPVLSGLTSVFMYTIIKRLILSSKDPVNAGFISLPLFYGFTVLVNVFSIIHDGPKLLYMDNIPLWMAAVISIAVSVTAMVVIQVFMVPWQRRQLAAQLQAEKPNVNFNIGESTGETAFSFSLYYVFDF